MADKDLLAFLKAGTEEWNAWRKENRESKIDLRRANLRELQLAGANLSGVVLSSADLSGSDLTKANFHNSILEGAKLTGVNLTEANLCEMNFSKTDLREATLFKAHLSDANLVEADLSHSDLRYASLHYAGLDRANLSEAQLMNADFLNTKLQGANLNGANLSGARLKGAILLGANLSNAKLASTELLNCVLADVNGLDICQHNGPSYLDMQTLQQSGPLPPEFLRGIGLSDSQIDYLRALHTQPIQFYSCFISYSSKDEAFTKRLHADLQCEGVRCWYAPEDIKGGQKLYEQIDEAIRLHDKLLLVLSPNSMDSEWVRTEIAKARQREIRLGFRVLFPISLVDYDSIKKWECFDADTGKDTAKEVREYYIPDFSNWKNHDEYKNSFDRLLKDLKNELERKPS
jgi:uncharacterized protein YjbI with pentapeptide repeats